MLHVCYNFNGLLFLTAMGYYLVGLFLALQNRFCESTVIVHNEKILIKSYESQQKDFI